MDAINTDAPLGFPSLERAEALSRLLARHNWKQETLAKHLGISIDKVSRYLMPIKLCKEMKALLRSAPPERQPPLGSIELLCRLTPALQQEFVRILPLDLSEATQIQWLKKTFVSRGIVLSRQRSRRKYRLAEVERLTRRFAAVSRQVCRCSDKIRDMTQEGRNVAFAVADDPERSESLRNYLRTLIEDLQTLDAFLELDIPPDKPTLPEKLPPKSVARVVVPRTVPVQIEKLKPSPPTPKPRLRMENDRGREIPKPPTRVAPSSERSVRDEMRYRKPVFSTSLARKVPAAPSVGAGGRERTVNVYDDRVFRITMKGLTRQQYVDAWEKGKLGFQEEGVEKPDFLPSLEQALDPNFAW